MNIYNKEIQLILDSYSSNSYDEYKIKGINYCIGDLIITNKLYEDSSNGIIKEGIPENSRTTIVGIYPNDNIKTSCLGVDWVEPGGKIRYLGIGINYIKAHLSIKDFKNQRDMWQAANILDI